MKIITGIFSSTHEDRHGDRIPKEILEGWVSQIKSLYIPFKYDHQNPIGVILAAKLRQFQDGEYALFGAAGIFENEEEKNLYKYKSPNEAFEEYIKILNDFGDDPLPLITHDGIPNKDGEMPMGFSVGFSETRTKEPEPGTMLIIESDRVFQKTLNQELREKYPDVKSQLLVFKAIDPIELTQLLIESAGLIVQIIALVLQIRQGQAKDSKSKIQIKIKKGGKSLTIDATNHPAQIEKIVKDFLKK